MANFLYLFSVDAPIIQIIFVFVCRLPQSDKLFEMSVKCENSSLLCLEFKLESRCYTFY